MLENIDRAQMKKAEIQELNKRIAEEKAVLDKYVKDLSGVCDTEFIKLIDQLSIGKSVILSLSTL